MTAPLLSVSNLTTSFRQGGQWTPVVKGISFDVNAGETVAIVGESGSGKSVTSLSIMRLIPPETGKIEGSIVLSGREILSLSAAELQRMRGNDVAMIFQEPMTSLNPVMTIGDQIAEVLVAHNGVTRSAARAEATRLLERVRVPAAAQRLDNFPHEFSGGMRQRVMIAIALACKPQLLIADEPTTALDVTVQAQTLDLIRELQKDEGMSVLFITHDMGVVAEIADRVVVMYRGDIVETGTTEQIFANPQRPYTRSLLMSVPRLGSMQSYTGPRRFPLVDKQTGVAAEPADMVDTAQPDAAPVLEVRNLVKRFDIRSPLLQRIQGRIHAVENVSFAIRPGETLSLVGESGCGKSTTGRTLMRLTDPTSGSIFLDGKDISRARGHNLRSVRQQIQMVFQDPFASLNPKLTVGQAIAEPLFIHGRAKPDEARTIVADLLDQVGLDPATAGRFPHEFSGGQRQRICIARALALNPKVIVADEAVSSLDVSVKAQVINLLLDLQERLGLAYLFISHDMAIVERISHRVAVMYLGEIVEIGPRQSIFGNPRHPYTRRLIDAVPIPDPAHRRGPSSAAAEDIPTPFRPADFVPTHPTFEQVGDDHFVRTRAQ